MDGTAIKELIAAMKLEPVVGPDGTTYFAVPVGSRMEKIPPLTPPLTYIKQGVVFHDRDSFIDYVNRYKTGASQIFAEPGFLSGTGVASMTAVLDYHKDAATPGYSGHVATYSMRYSEEWKAWHAACADQFKQAEFAEFVEENRLDIIEPTAAGLIDLVSEFKATKKTEFDSMVRQPDGSVRLNYSQDVEQKGSALMPEALKIGIPVYFRGNKFEIPVFVRFRISGPGVVFQLKLDRADIFEEVAFAATLKDVAEKTVLPVYLGRRSA